MGGTRPLHWPPPSPAPMWPRFWTPSRLHYKFLATPLLGCVYINAYNFLLVDQSSLLYRIDHRRSAASRDSWIKVCTVYWIVALTRTVSRGLHSSYRLTLHKSKLAFYPRDAMLARVFATATCPSVQLSVCHEPVLCQNEASWFLHHPIAPQF